MKLLKFFSLAMILSVFSYANATTPEKFGPSPNSKQSKYLANPMAAFIHFGINTYTGTDGIEWGNQHKEPPSSFNPIGGKIDTEQWVRILKNTGFTRIIIVLKHHDGFCLWPTAETDYNISKSPYLEGNGDIAKEVSEACDKYGMDMGIYLSPWDAHEPSYGDSSPGDYNDFYANQLTEVLGGKYGRMNPVTQKREITEIWLDGATAATDPQTYDFTRYLNIVHSLQPKCLTWMSLAAVKNYSGSAEDFPLDAFWVGNEAGYANDPVWYKANVNGNSVNAWQPNGKYFIIPEADVSIRPGWFYHSSQDGSVKSLSKLSEIYFKTIGMGIPLLLNVPPNKAGRIHENDSIALTKLHEALSNTFETNLLSSSMNITSSSSRDNFNATNLLDNDSETYWALPNGETTGNVTIDLGKDTPLDIIKIAEYLPLGQRISKWKVEVEVYGNWQEFGKGQTIGSQRIIKGELLPVRKIRFTILNALAPPILNSIEAYQSDASIVAIGEVPPGITPISADNLMQKNSKKTSKLKLEVIEFPQGKWPTVADVRFYDNINGKRIEVSRDNFTASATSEAKKYSGESPSLASNTIDDDNTSIWQPEWYPSKTQMPQSLIYEFGKEINLAEISVLPRQNSTNDVITKFNIYTAPTNSADYELSLEGGIFAQNQKIAQYTSIQSNNWIVLHNYYKQHVAIQSKTDDAVASFNVVGGWVKITGTKSPQTGIFEVWIDDEKIAEVDTYAETEQKNSILYENNDISAAEHHITIRATGRKNTLSNESTIILQDLQKLSENVNGLFELKKRFMDVTEDAESVKFTIVRKGNLDIPADITYITTPGTGVHGKTYKDKTEILHFNVGEKEKTATVEIINNALGEGNKDFFIELNNPTSQHVLGAINQMRILVYDDDSDSSNPNLEGYCDGSGTQHNEMKTFLKSAKTTGATKNLDYQANVSPDNVYVKLTDNTIEARRNSSFLISLKANEAGERSTSAVYQDFRYCKAYGFIDWNGDLMFSENEKVFELGENPPNNVRLGNYDEVMNITKLIQIPSNAVLQNIAFRVIFHNAWQTLESACSPVKEGMVYDFKLNIQKEKTTAIPTVIKNKEFTVFCNNNKVYCSGNFTADTRINIYTIDGRLIKTTNTNYDTNKISISLSHKGLFFLRIQRNKDIIETHKIVLN